MPPRAGIPVAEDVIYTIEVSDDCEIGSASSASVRPPTTTTVLPAAAAKEKQISIDPISLKQPHNGVEEYAFSSSLQLPPGGPSSKPKFISASLPCSASSSPRTPSSLMKNLKKWRNHHSPPSPPPVATHLAQQHSVALVRLKLLQQESLRRSKSCGEGRACRPSVDQFDFAVKSPSSTNINRCEREMREMMESITTENSTEIMHGKRSTAEYSTDLSRRSNADQDFKCGALCLFLPNFSGKAKQVKPAGRRSEESDEDNVVVVSRTVSLEKFECGSWASSALVKEGERDESLNSFFDLPLELIRGGGSGTNSPVATAFVFERKGVLKKNASTRRSHETSSSNRHVRFSTSPPTSYPSSPFCISPRLQRARAEFNAYLEEAQRA
ncbi:hypothetical protein H6P81_019435 [Aristolochia fimbriata]|uniref:Uncharacterized protein n=1 Tax=Aristolochia fimbriata TaxID=158543 RepID=A0AAV7DT89_ARIFI|nr:hypothetical protein H6P81_019435 [Aristolochia fimbriata]